MPSASTNYIKILTHFLLGCLLGAMIVWWFLPTSIQAPYADVLSEGDQFEAISMIASEPVRLRIPAINLDTTFSEPLGVNEDRTVVVPNTYDAVGWYQYSPTPGEYGPSVVLGHVGSVAGPAVFWRLPRLKAGDDIFVDRVDGSTATFTVTHLADYNQKGFPTALVYGDIDHAGLRLITCSGTFNFGTQEYSHNLVVFAELKTATSTLIE